MPPLWIVLAVAVSAKSLIQPRSRSVYSVYERGAHAWWDGKIVYHGHTDYLYTPTFSVAVSPLVFLPTELGGVLWNCLSVGILATLCSP